MNQLLTGFLLALLVFPVSLFAEGATTTKHVFSPDGTLIATLEATSTSGSSGNTGFKAPSATGATWNEWTSPANAYASDNADATADASRTTSDEQDYYNFSFTVPSGATINGIEISIEGESAERLPSDPVGTYTSSVAVRLSWNGGTNWTSIDQKNGIFPNDSGTDTTQVWGSATSTWGRTWSDTELSNSNFRVHVDDVSGGYRGETYFDHIQVKVHYTTAGGSATSTTRFIHTDHLGGTNVTTNASSTVVEVTDYYPYGKQRINTTSATQEQRKFTGHEYDLESDLTYAKQRYYEQDIGRFLSVDPAARDNPQRFSKDPQQMNLYSYARNNPLILTDPTGHSAAGAPMHPVAILLAMLFSPMQGSFDPEFETAQFEAQNSVENQAFNMAIGWAMPGGGAKNATNATGRAVSSLPNDALVVRGGGLANQAADKFRLGPSNTPGISGFSVQCSAECTNLSQVGLLGQYLPNSTLSVTTASQIRKVGGDVVPTPGRGEHATVTNVNESTASQLPWQEIKNPSPSK